MIREVEGRWPSARAWEWYNGRPWLCGFNYLPAYAVNFIELWRVETFDPAAIDRELALAASTGLNTCRVNLSFDLWKSEPREHLANVERFLAIARSHGISTMLCLFDDCGQVEPVAAAQPDPVPGLHNSRQVPCPAHSVVERGLRWTELEEYVKAFVSVFAADDRVLCWDVYNEPGQCNLGNASLPLLRSVYQWTRECRPSQPLTAGIWHGELSELNECMLSLSDVVSFHSYGALEDVKRFLDLLKQEGRPVFCTEWLARSLGSRVETVLPYLRAHNIACYCWGLVNGRSQTHIPWAHLGGDSREWFHDLFHADGTPYAQQEIDLVRKLNRPPVQLA